MASQVETEKFFLEREQIPDDITSEFNYDEVSVDDDFIPQEIDEDLESAVRTITEAAQDAQAAIKRDGTPKPTVTQRPEVVEDFVRNFLVRKGMHKTLDCFETEWYELLESRQLQEQDVSIVPDVYIRNQQLDQELTMLRVDSNKYRDAAMKAKDTYVKLRKERDYHKLHHRRVVQEKNKLLADIRRLKTHYASYEPTLQLLKQKYEMAMKEKMLSKLERDRAVGQVVGLQSTLKNLEATRNGSMSALMSGLHLEKRGSATVEVDKHGRGPTQRALAAERQKWAEMDVQLQTEARHPDDTEFPMDTGVNPFLSKVKGPPGHLTRTGGFRLTNSFQAHSLAISSLSLHPRKQIIATTSDDHTWKMWAVPAGDIIMTGEGHTDWVSSCDFHPVGGKLATGSGDTTVKIWDFAKAECIHTFTDHTHAVWSVSWHSCGDFLATASMDNTSKIWDLNSARCRYTLRGHADSVNAIQFLPYSNTLATCSADKTLSLWDARTGLCAQTFYGHLHSVNDITFSLRGDTIASCDSYGVVKLWDVRTVAPMSTIDCGPHPANKVAFDSSGSVLAISSNDATVKMYEIAKGKSSDLIGHEDAVQTAIFDRAGDFLVSAGSDLTVRVWS